MPVITNKKYGSTVIHLTANETFVVVGNNTVSNLAIGDEIVAGATVRRVFHSMPANSTGGGYWAIHRGANLFGVYTLSGEHDYSGEGMVSSIDKAANLVFTINGGTVGHLIVEVRKEVPSTNTVY